MAPYLMTLCSINYFPSLSIQTNKLFLLDWMV